jgi:hypothetical protein
MSKTCNNCGETKTPSTVPYQVLKDFKDTSTATIKRLWILIVILVLLIVGSNMAWLYAWNSYDYVSEEIIVEQDAQDGGNANYIGNDGDIINGLSESDDKTQNP